MSQRLIEKLGLEPLPGEGGYFKRTYVSDQTIEFAGQQRSIASTIYYYLGSEDFSAWHQLDCDEVWHFYAGDSCVVHMINAQGELHCQCVGDPHNGEVSQLLIPAGTWFAVEVCEQNTYVLVGCACAPAYDVAGFKLGKRDELIAQFPEHAGIINRLTRE